MLTLIGSQTSPYVRRIRLLLENVSYEFSTKNIFEANDRLEISKFTPLKKIPILITEEGPIFDSRVISQYLTEKFNFHKLNLVEENILTTIDGVNDSLVLLLLFQRNNINPGPDNNFIKIQNERINEGLQWLDHHILQKKFESWHYPSMSLFCLLDWINFRNLWDLSPYQACLAWCETHFKQNRQAIRISDPRITT